MSRVVLRWLHRLLLLAVCGVVALVVVVLLVLPRTHDAAALTVLSGSMRPGIEVGSVAVIRPVDPADLGVGDVATYQIRPDAPDLITHRIIAVEERAGMRLFELQGDANRGADDELVPAAAIRGQLWFDVPYLGTARDSLQDSRAVATLGALGLSGYALAMLVSAARDGRRRTTPGSASMSSSRGHDRAES